MGLSKSIGINANKNLGQTSRNLTRATEELMTGRKSPTKHVVSVLKGLQNESTAKVLEAVAESAKYGSTLLNVATSSLYELLDDLTELRETIAQAETADANITANLTTFYQSKVAAITAQLANGNFGGRYLYDGSMSSGTAVPAQGVPNGAAPLTIRVGESFNNNVSIIIPKLLSGKVNAADAAVAGQFTPLFPATAATTNAGNIAASINNGDIDTNNAYNDNIVAAAAASTGNYNGVMSALLSPTKLQPLIDAIATTATNLGGNCTQANVDALGGTNAVKAAITTNITAILSNAAVSIANSGATALTPAQVKTVIAASVNSFFSAGTLNTSANRRTADGVATAAMSTVNSLISSLNGQQSIIEGAIDGLNNSIAANKEAANDLLSANIVEAASEVKAILALIQSVYFVLGNIDQINQLNAILLRA